jgi:CRP/FNR family cyclic AMP-dependent transcriptional regulator
MQTDGIWANIFRLGHTRETFPDTLRRVPMFKELGDRELRTLSALVHTRTYKSDELIFMEKEPGAGMYVVLSGGVDILLDHESEKPLLLAQLEAGDFFGEMALLGEGERSATARARESSELIGFFHPDLIELMGLHPGTGARITLGSAQE